MNASQQKMNLIVVGGGPAGMTTAIAAARNGAKTLLIEQGSCLGGVATSGLLSIWGPFVDHDPCWDLSKSTAIPEKAIARKRKVCGTPITQGIAAELLDKLIILDGARDCQNGFIPLNPETLKYVAEQMLDEAGARILYFSQVVDIIKNKNRIEAVIVANKAGLTTYDADVFVDASGDADLAAFAGAEFQKGRDQDGKMQGVTLVFRLGGVKIQGRIVVEREEVKRANSIFENAWKKGMVSAQYHVGCINPIPGMDGVVAVNSQHTFDVDGTDPMDLTRAMFQGREDVREMAGLFKKYLRGFEDSFLIDTAPQVGVRETRRIVGEYMLTKEDVLQSKKFKDTIGRNAYNIDIHLPSNKKQSLADLFPKGGTYHDIPYRSLIPKKMENLLVAGRSISATHEAQSSIRIMPCCMVTGQAAGTAAALSIKQKTFPRKLEIGLLQDTLRKQNACV
ncbi:MAG: FAD-dependent oxidoreductase [Verrucomicrobiae bacterium]|nr:FAD-dependent oxidoreductase [Verrucomicrobiae bacterium]